MEHKRAPRPYAAPTSAGVTAKSRLSYAKAVGSFVPRLTRKVFEKFGFSAAALITDWPEIAGPEIAAWCQPERLKWPRAPEGDRAESSSRRPSATLLLRVDPARALDIQYRERQILERINSYFGYRAVGELRVVQAPLEPRETPRQALTRKPAAPPPAPSPELSQITDEPLRAALARLQANLSRG